MAVEQNGATARDDVPEGNAGRRSEEVPALLDGERLDRAVSLISGASRAETARWVADGLVTADGRAVQVRSHRVRAGSVLSFPALQETPQVRLAGDASVPLTIVYEDDDVVVIDKPAGIVVHPGAGNDHGTLVHGLLARFPKLAILAAEASERGDTEAAMRPGIVQRLDRGTSGLLVVGLTSQAVGHLVEQLSARTVERRYRALVWGRLETSAGLVDAPVGRSPSDPTRMAVVASGRPARTRYAVIQAFVHPEPSSLLECRLETGRTHQIRVHLSAIGHPVVGDDRYGGARPSLLPDLDRPFLHASVLGFVHPVTGAALRFVSPLPSDLEAVLADFW